MTTLLLHKPLYQIESYATRFNDSVPYHLRPDVRQWLEERDPDYKLRVEHSIDLEHGRRYLLCYLDIKDPDVAMLFKLTWM